MNVYKTDIPAKSLIRDILPADYTDAFQCVVPGEPKCSPDDLQVSFWTVMPGWVNALMKLRNILVKPFGLQGGESIAVPVVQAIRNGESHGLMAVPFKNDRETVVKLSDKHLDAYMSVYIDPNNPTTSVSVITAVKYHNRLGRAYFFIIRPFHKIIVRSMLKNTINRECKKMV